MHHCVPPLSLSLSLADFANGFVHRSQANISFCGTLNETLLMLFVSVTVVIVLRDIYLICLGCGNF